MNLNLSALRILPSAYLRTGSWYMPFGRRPEGPVRAPLIKPNQTIRIPENAQPGTILGKLVIFFKPDTVQVEGGPPLVLIDSNGIVVLLRHLIEGEPDSITITATNSKGTSPSQLVNVALLFEPEPVVAPAWFAPPLGFAPGMPL